MNELERLGLEKVEETKTEVIYRDPDDLMSGLRIHFNKLTKSVTIFKGIHFIDISWKELNAMEKVATELEQRKWEDIDSSFGS